jgi:hypothetical protein
VGTHGSIRRRVGEVVESPVFSGVMTLSNTVGGK